MRPDVPSPVLYDTRVDGYPNERGASFRTLQVRVCQVCGSKTNRCVMGGYPGYGRRYVCQHAAECWHHEIALRVEWATAPHPAGYAAELAAEIQAMQQAASLITDDIEGEPDFTLVAPVTNTFAKDPENKTCRHMSGSFSPPQWMVTDPVLVEVIARLMVANNLHRQHGEDTIDVLMKCGAFLAVPTTADGWLVEVAHRIDAQITKIRETS